MEIKETLSTAGNGRNVPSWVRRGYGKRNLNFLQLQQTIKRKQNQIGSVEDINGTVCPYHKTRRLTLLYGGKKEYNASFFVTRKK